MKRRFQIITYFRLVAITLECLSIDLPCVITDITFPFFPPLRALANSPATQTALSQSGATGKQSGFGSPLFFSRYLFAAFFRLLTGFMFFCACRASNTCSHACRSCDRVSVVAADFMFFCDGKWLWVFVKSFDW